MTLYFDARWSNTDNWQMSVTATTRHTGKDLVTCCASLKDSQIWHASCRKFAMDHPANISDLYCGMPNLLVAWVLVCPPHSKMIKKARACGAGMLLSCVCHFYTGHQQEADAPALNFLHQRLLCASVLCGTAPSLPRWVCTTMCCCSRSP